MLWGEEVRIKAEGGKSGVGRMDGEIHAIRMA